MIGWFRREWPQMLLLSAMFALAAWTWHLAPARVPVHWGLDGRPDRFGGRFEGVFLQPLLALGTAVLLAFLPRLDPGRANYATFAGAYAFMRTLVLVVLAGVQVATTETIRGHAVDMMRIVPPMTGLLFIGFGNVLGKVRPNWFVGIRTPWTLSSKRSWSQTHRAGGWVFVGVGLLLTTLSVLRAPAWRVVVFAVSVVAMLGLVVYSYLVWKDDPDAVSPAGTRPGPPEGES